MINHNHNQPRRFQCQPNQFNGYFPMQAPYMPFNPYFMQRNIPFFHAMPHHFHYDFSQPRVYTPRWRKPWSNASNPHGPKIKWVPKSNVNVNARIR